MKTIKELALEEIEKVLEDYVGEDVTDGYFLDNLSQEISSGYVFRSEDIDEGVNLVIGWYLSGELGDVLTEYKDLWSEFPENILSNPHQLVDILVGYTTHSLLSSISDEDIESFIDEEDDGDTDYEYEPFDGTLSNYLVKKIIEKIS